MKKTLLIIGAGIMQVPAIRIARQMGLTTVVTDYNQNALGMKMADHSIVMSTRDIEGNVRVARDFHARHGIDGVITIGTDASMTVAAVAQALNLNGIKFEAAEMASNKIKMRQRLHETGVAVPAFRSVWTVDEAHQAFSELGFPAVIKPSDNMGARGVMKVSHPEEIDAAFRYAKSCTTSGEIIVEQFMHGDELSIDVLIWEGKPLVWAIGDRLIEYPPYFVEIGHILPSEKPPDVQEAAKELMVRAFTALEITTGAAKGDIKLTPEGPKIVEVAARLSGGFMSGYTYPYATGVSIIQGALKIALGQKPSFPQPKSRTSIERAIIPHHGHIISIEGVDEARKIDGVRDIFLSYHEGDDFPVPRSNLDKVGHIIVAAPSRSEAAEIIEQALRTIRVEIGPSSVTSLKDIYKSARMRMGNTCKVCDPCDGGTFCQGRVPGMGGVGANRAFCANLNALQRWQVKTRAINPVKEPDTSCHLLGYQLALPVIAAPITGVQTNMGGGMTEEAYVRSVVRGCRQERTLACVGDRATPGKYRVNIAAVAAENGWGIPIFKPLSNYYQLKKRIIEAEQAGVAAVGIDIDSAPLVTMQRHGAKVEPKSREELRDLIGCTSLPFILKGILSVEDAEMAVRAGATAIVVSNHGGRILDALPGAGDVLAEIVAAVKDKTIIVADGGVRSGEDVFKYIALGADLVTIGRPLAICSLGAGAVGVSFFLDHLKNGLRNTMLLTGCQTLKDISLDHLRSV